MTPEASSRQKTIFAVWVDLRMATTNCSEEVWESSGAFVERVFHAKARRRKAQPPRKGPVLFKLYLDTDAEFALRFTIHALLHGA